MVLVPVLAHIVMRIQSLTMSLIYSPSAAGEGKSKASRRRRRRLVCLPAESPPVIAAEHCNLVTASREP